MNNNKKTKEDFIEFVKEAKNIVVRKQSYEDASIIKDLEKLISIDEVLPDSVYESVLQIVNRIFKKFIVNEAPEKIEKQLDYSSIGNEISKWLFNYANNAKMNGYVIGISGGIDSAVCSTLCAMTGLPLTVIRMPIHQSLEESDRGAKHISWLKENFSNITSLDIDLTDCYDLQISSLSNSGAFENVSEENIFLTSANTRSRLRMSTLYGVGGGHKLLVCGTGNKVEDFGIGFFTKFGDGGVDLSPIGELTKTEVYALASSLKIIQEILDARPTDGLWTDGRTDEDQIGATYPELEWAMKFCEKTNKNTIKLFVVSGMPELFEETLTERQCEVLKIYWKRHTANLHKMSMPPICSIEALR